MRGAGFFVSQEPVDQTYAIGTQPAIGLCSQAHGSPSLRRFVPAPLVLMYPCCWFSTKHGNRLLGVGEIAHQLKEQTSAALHQPTPPNDDSSGLRCAIPHPRQWHRGRM